MVFRINRSHEQIGNEANYQKPGHQEHGRAICLGFGHAGFNLGCGDVIDEARAEQRGDGRDRF